MISAVTSTWPAETTSPGAGAYVDGSIFWGCTLAFDQVIPATNLVINRSDVPAAFVALGSGNLTEDPRFVNAATGKFDLRPGSPALGTGPNGLDIGAMVPQGASLPACRWSPRTAPT